MTQFFASTQQATELFDAFLSSEMEESISPFLTPNSRRLGKNLRLKASLLAAPLLALSFIFSFFPSLLPLAHLFLLMTYFFAGVPALIGAVEDLCLFEINIDVLMVLAAFLAVFIGSAEEGGLLLVLFSFSSALEKVVSSKAKQSIHALKKLAPSRVSALQPDGTLVERSVHDVTPGTLILVKAGQVVPLDGKVIAGSSFINLVHITGENLPVARHAGDYVQAGASNLDGALTLEVTHTSSDSTVSRIIQMIHHAQEAKPQLQRWFDAFINRYASSIISFSALFALLLPLFTTIPYLGQEGSIYRALAFLIAASPCALILAIPIAYLSAISACARHGILLKGGITLDALARCQILALDKTGTLTEGRLQCIAIESEQREEALQIAYALEQNVEHPIAHAICRYATAEGLLPASLTHFRAIPGYGVEALYQNQQIYLGNREWIAPHLSAEQRLSLEQLCAVALKKGETVAILCVGQKLSLFRFKDQLRKGSVETLEALKTTWNLRTLMLTGDHTMSAEAIAREAGIVEVLAELKPEDKLRHIEELSQNFHLAMVGDGINDAPALARASVGIAMGGMGTQTASAAADIILLQDHIDQLDWLFAKAHHTTYIVSQNVWLAAGAILCAVVPALLGFLPLWSAVLLHEGGTVLVGLNALRLLKT